MNLNIQQTAFVDGIEVKPGARWPVHNPLPVSADVRCVSTKPDRFVGSFLIGGTSVLETERAESVEAAANDLRQLLVVRVRRLLTFQQQL